MSSIFNSNLVDYQNPCDKQELFFKRMPEMNYEYSEHYVVIDSKDRDLTVFPNPNKYVVQFNNGDDGNIQEQFRNIVSIQLIDAIVPNPTASEVAYLTLDIPELKPSYAGTNNHLSNVFGVLLPEDNGTPFARCKFVSPSLNKYRIPIASLNKLTLEFKDSSGAFYTSASFANEVTIDPLKQNQLFFKIVTRNPDYKPLEPILT